MNTLSSQSPLSSAYLGIRDSDAQCAKPVTVFTQLDQAVSILNEARAAAASVANRLCGQTPEAGSKSEANRLPQGIFDATGEAASSVNEYAQSIMRDMNRIKSQID